MIIIDTHTLIWWLKDKDKIPALASEVIKNEILSGTVSISAISFWEIAMLIGKKRISLNVSVEALASKVEKITNVQIVPITAKIAIESVHLENFFNKDPADRLIVATSNYLNIPLVTIDKKIRDYDGVETIWD